MKAQIITKGYKTQDINNKIVSFPDIFEFDPSDKQVFDCEHVRVLEEQKEETLEEQIARKKQELASLTADITSLENTLKEKQLEEKKQAEADKLSNTDKVKK